MKWIECKDSLPVLNDGEPNYNWVLVSSEDMKWAIARYGHKDIDGKITACWEFFDTNEDMTTACFAGDAIETLHIDEIKYWLNIPLFPFTFTQKKPECENYAHVWTWYPKDNALCLRCGILKESTCCK